MNARRMVFAVGLCMLLFWGTAYGTMGVDDNVPAQELIFPVICEGTIGADNQPVFGTLNTFWSYAETKGQDTYLELVLRDRKGDVLWDYDDHLTPRDVGPNEDPIRDCQSWVKSINLFAQQKLLTTIGGKDYFVGYLTLSMTLINSLDKVQNLIGWVTLYDAKKSNDNLSYTTASFKPYQAEGGADPATFAEGGTRPIYAHEYYLRYYLQNDNEETYNWWIVLRSAGYCHDKPSYQCHSMSTNLVCIMCDENEHCLDTDIPVPDRLNIINVGNYIPAGLFSGYPKKGFASCKLMEQAFDDDLKPVLNEDFTAFMWSYQRQQRLGKIAYPVDPKKLDKFDIKYGIILDNELSSVIDPADRLRRYILIGQ